MVQTEKTDIPHGEFTITLNFFNLEDYNPLFLFSSAVVRPKYTLRKREGWVYITNNRITIVSTWHAEDAIRNDVMNDVMATLCVLGGGLWEIITLIDVVIKEH